MGRKGSYFFGDGTVARAEGGRHGGGGDEADLGEGGGDEEEGEEELEAVGAGGATKAARERERGEPPLVVHEGGHGEPLLVAGQPVGRRQRGDKAPQQARRRQRHRVELDPLHRLLLRLSDLLRQRGWGGRLTGSNNGGEG